MLYVHHNHSTTDIDHYPFFSSAGAMQRGISDDRVISVSMIDRNPVIGLGASYTPESPSVKNNTYFTLFLVYILMSQIRHIFTSRY